jgi:hypothetical protein
MSVISGNSCNERRNSFHPAIEEQAECESEVNGADFPCARHTSFASFNNKYPGGTCYVIGRGRTMFDYQNLATIIEPIFFINDAVCLEKYARSETFFFAHDIEMRTWLDGSMKSTAVLPVNGTILGDAPGVVLNHAGPIVYYHRQDEDREELMGMTRDQVADAAALFGHSGTIHSVLHFIWYCGFRRVIYIGCDGINDRITLANQYGAKDGYDVRLKNRSQTTPGWHYSTIRRVQEFLAAFLEVETTHIGTPVCFRR